VRLADHIRIGLDPAGLSDRSAVAVRMHVNRVLRGALDMVRDTDPDAVGIVNLLVDTVRDAGQLVESDVRTLRWVCQTRLDRPPGALRESATEPPGTDSDVEPADADAVRSATATAIATAIEATTAMAGDAPVVSALLNAIETISIPIGPASADDSNEALALLKLLKEAAGRRVAALRAAVEQAEREAAQARLQAAAEAAELARRAAAAGDAEREAAQARQRAAAAEDARRTAQDERDAAIRELGTAKTAFDEKAEALDARGAAAQQAERDAEQARRRAVAEGAEQARRAAAAEEELRTTREQRDTAIRKLHAAKTAFDGKTEAVEARGDAHRQAADRLSDASERTDPHVDDPVQATASLAATADRPPEERRASSVSIPPADRKTRETRASGGAEERCDHAASGPPSDAPGASGRRRASAAVSRLRPRKPSRSSLPRERAAL
jgi:hypothetical protein